MKQILTSISLILITGCATNEYKDYLDSKKPPIVKNINFCKNVEKNKTVTVAKDESNLKSCEFLKKVETDICHENLGENIEVESLKHLVQEAGGNILVIEDEENKYQRKVGLAYRCLK